MQQVTLYDAQTRLLNLVDAALNGEIVVIVTEDQQQIQLVPFQKQPRQPGSAKGLFTMADDFDAPLDDFGEYME